MIDIITIASIKTSLQGSVLAEKPLLEINQGDKVVQSQEPTKVLLSNAVKNDDTYSILESHSRKARNIHDPHAHIFAF